MLDANGDREPDYWISDMDPATGIFRRIADILNTGLGKRVSGHSETQSVCHVRIQSN